ncbi:MAG: PEP-CTERM sorting domain-containing protein [Coleofasciculus chthonoplastes F1-TOW-03]
MLVQSMSSILGKTITLSVLPLSLAMVMANTAHAATVSYIAGNADNFNTSDGLENSTPSAALEQWADQNYAYGASTLFDRSVNDYDDYFVHTFSDLHSNLSNPIVFGELEISLRATNSSMSYNDAINLRFTNPDGTLTPGWGRHIGQGDSTEGLLPTTWSNSQSHTFTFNLANLPLAPGQNPTASNLLPTLNQKGFLDVVVEDDTSIDYIKLTVSDVPEPLTILGSATALGFGALLKRQQSRKQNKS